MIIVAPDACKHFTRKQLENIIHKGEIKMTMLGREIEKINSIVDEARKELNSRKKGKVTS